MELSIPLALHTSSWRGSLVIHKEDFIFYVTIEYMDRLCGLVVKVHGYRSKDLERREYCHGNPLL
jgi:hypothetical protein